MIEIALSQAVCVTSKKENGVLQEYVHALLARQQALDLLESIHYQFNQVWGSMRRMIEGRPTVQCGQAVKAARAAQADQARTNYRALEKRREECIAALHRAERQANAALQRLLAERPRLGVRRRLKSSARAAGRKLKNTFSCN